MICKLYGLNDELIGEAVVTKAGKDDPVVFKVTNPGVPCRVEVFLDLLGRTPPVEIGDTVTVNMEGTG